MQNGIAQYAGKVRKEFPPLKRHRKSSLKPRLAQLHGTKLLLTDLYGTVFVANQLPKTAQYRENLLKGFKEAAKKFRLEKLLEKIGPGKKPGVLLQEMFFEEVKKEHERKRKRGASSPEVRSEKIWGTILKRLFAEGRQARPKEMRGIAIKAAYLSAWVFEPTGIYASFLETALKLKKRRIFLGIASNAQFYSKISLNLGLREASGGKIKRWEQLFDRGFSAFSFEVGESKPGRKIFEKILRNAEKQGIKRKEITFMGNDLFKDIALGKKMGFKTILFAGDAKSLRLRKGDRRVKGVKPDAVVTDWRQLLKVIG